MTNRVLPGVSGIVAFIDVCQWGYRTANFHPKVKLPQPIYACIFVVITLVCPTKVKIMKLKCSVLNRMCQHDFLMKQIFFNSIFLSENTGQLTKQAGYLDHDPWDTRYNVFHRFKQVKFDNGGLILSLSKLLLLLQQPLKMMLAIKVVKNWLKNNHLVTLI